MLTLYTHTHIHTHIHTHSANVLINSSMVCKLNAIGRDSLHCGSKCDSLRWIAPETLTSQMFSTSSDVWSLAVTIWEVATLGATPYTNCKNGASVVVVLCVVL